MSRCRKELDEKIQREGSYEFVEDDLVTILPVWRPANQSGNAILNHQFFRAVSIDFTVHNQRCC